MITNLFYFSRNYNLLRDVYRKIYNKMYKLDVIREHLGE